MSAPKSSRLRRILGYGLFTLVSFLICLYLTFDYSLLIPRFSQLLQQATGSEVSMENVEGYRLSGIRISGLNLSPPGRSEKAGAENSLLIDQLTLRLKILPLLWGRRSLYFSARLAGGGVEGSVSNKGQQAEMAVAVKGLTLDRIGLGPWLGPDAIQLGGKLDGQANLTAAELSNPAKWEGRIEFHLDKGKVYPFKTQGVPIEEIQYDRGDLKLSIKEGTANLETFKLQGPELPIEAKGKVSLRAPFSQSILDITGTIEASPAYQQKMPLLNGLLPPDKTFVFKGPIETLAGMLRAP